MIRITTEVHCDGCGNWAQGVVSNRVTARVAREQTKKNGWSYQANAELKDLCPYCLEKERAK